MVLFLLISSFVLVEDLVCVLVEVVDVLHEVGVVLVGLGRHELGVAEAHGLLLVGEGDLGGGLAG